MSADGCLIDVLQSTKSGHGEQVTAAQNEKEQAAQPPDSLWWVAGGQPWLFFLVSFEAAEGKNVRGGKTWSCEIFRVAVLPILSLRRFAAVADFPEFLRGQTVKCNLWCVAPHLKTAEGLSSLSSISRELGCSNFQPGS